MDFKSTWKVLYIIFLLELFFSFTVMFDIKFMVSTTVCSCLLSTERIQLLHLLLPLTESIGFLYWPSGEVYAYSCLSSGLKHLFLMDKLLGSQKSTDSSPASFLTQSPNFPPTFDSALCPIFVLRSLVIISMSCLGV